MKVPLTWLRDYVPLNVSIAELVDRLTISGLEVAGVRLVGLPVPEGLRAKQTEVGPVWDKDKIVTAQVLAIDKHPNADKLKLVQLDYGTGTPKQVVTGAPNIAVGESGHKVVLGLTGCKYFDGHAIPKGIKELKPSVLRGVPSDSMVMSTYELGIDEEHEGIILLDSEAPVGKALADLIGDAVIEIDVLPNMARCLSMIGVAREVAAISGQTASVPSLAPPQTAESNAGLANIKIADAKLCPRYTATIIRNAKITPSPFWLKTRLTYAGMRPISNIVDVTNYVMLEYGQPLHAFDYDVLKERAGGQAPTITVRAAQAGEKIKTLDGQDRTLSPDNLVIADVLGPIALAGVMGGAETEVSATTRSILLESANFDPVSVRKTARQFNLFSEASTRFSRGIHTEVVMPAALRAWQLIKELVPGSELAGMVDDYPAPLPTQVITLQKSEITRLLGIDFPNDEVERILTALQFSLKKEGEGRWQVTVPPYRTDIQSGQADLIEELVRIYGYDRLPATLLSGELPPQRANRALQLEERTRDILASSGLQEVITYSLTSREREAPLGQEGHGYVELVNEISPERKVMRRTVLAGVLEVAALNLKTTDTVRLFELGLVYLPKEGDRLPTESRRLAIVLTGRRDVPAWDDQLSVKPTPIDFFDLKGIVEVLLRDLHAGNVSYRPAKQVSYLHPGRSAEIFVNDESIGLIGELHPKTVQKLELGERSFLVADLDLERILQVVPFRYPYVPVPIYQAALRDIAVVVLESVTSEQLVAEMRSAGGDLLTEIRLFDLYHGDQVPEGSKSLAYALSYQAFDRTLSDKEIEKVHKKIEDRLRQTLKAKIRGKDLS